MEVHELGILALDFRQAGENVCMANEIIKIAAQRIDFDAGGFSPALVAGEPGVEARGEVNEREFVGGFESRPLAGVCFSAGILERGEANQPQAVVLADEMGTIPQPELEDDFFAGGI